MIIVKFIFGCLLIGLGCLTIFKWKWCQLQQCSKRVLIFLFLFKVAASFSLISLYTYYYKDKSKADIYKYFDDGKVLASSLSENPVHFFKMMTGIDDNNRQLQQAYYQQMNHWTRSGNLPSILNDNRTIIRVNALLHLISFQSIWIHGIFFAWLSTLGLLLLLKAFEQYLFKPKLILYLLFIFPSIALWFSGPLKETLLLASMGLFFYAYLKERHFLIRTILFILGIFLLLNTKMYLFPIFIIFIITHELIRLIRRPIIVISTLLLSGVILSWGLDHKEISPAQIIHTKQRDFINLAKGGFIIEKQNHYYKMPYELREQFDFISDSIVRPRQLFTVAQTDIKLNFIDSVPLKNITYKVYFDQKPASSYFPIRPIQPNTLSVLKATPGALFNSIARPLPEVSNPFSILTFIENIFYLIIIILAFKSFTINTKWNSSPLAVSLLFCGILVLLLIGWTTPVAGAIVRYKIPGILLIIVSFGMNEYRFLNKIKL